MMAQDKWANPQKMWDERFSEAEPVYGEEPNAFLAKQSERFKAGMKLLVPGDGYGRNGIWLARQGFQVHTVDLSPVGVERARKTAEGAGVQMTIECADLGTWEWPADAFDGAFAIFLHLPEELRKQVHAGILRSVKPGGFVILQAFHPEQLQHSSGGPKQVELLYSAAMLRRDFAGVEVVELEEKETDIQEGHKHSGLAAVVQGVFRRAK
jgi:SAM-dependent methyltransferase